VKKTVTFRFDPDLLEHARTKARAENRTLTNFIETVVKKEIDRVPAPGENFDRSVELGLGEA
jgi:predicted HicB family RNase H-like nuclease